MGRLRTGKEVACRLDEKRRFHQPYELEMRLLWQRNLRRVRLRPLSCRGGWALKFIEYVDFPEENHWIPSNGHEQVDTARRIGNKATHEIAISSYCEAVQGVLFCC